ncbi:YbfB/YjiJ family MFS transporter [Sulfitobacter sp. D35]|uniref:YbfB/YjiJ family MFS transporter n=1 Tax=Sulfitobacter sp. D35 TaxID=3083252 RepID=UPI00296F47E8|nr:YbfB/YjiJ family MFS transporter [Sulfitobacter sp. D35]
MTPNTAESHARSWLILAGLTLGVTVTNGFARFAYGLILPAMRAELGWSYAQAGWLNTANAFGYVMGAVATMWLIARLPPTRLFTLGILGTTLSLLATGLDPELGWQTFWRIAAGMTGALSFSTAGVLAARLFPGDARRNALGIALLFGTGGGLGIVLSGASIPLILEGWGTSAWPWGWGAIGTLSLLCLPLSLWSARSLSVGTQEAPRPVSLPLRAIAPELAGYAGFGLGYIVYLTFLAAWMTDQAATPRFIAAVWMLMGLCICVSPFLWRPVFARWASGLPLALVLSGIALGSVLPVVLPPGWPVIASAVVFGCCVFMAPPAITSFIRQNLEPAAWGAAMSLFTAVFAVSQTFGPWAAGLIGDLTGNIGDSLLAGAAILMCGAICALAQKSLPRAG